MLHGKKHDKHDHILRVEHKEPRKNSAHNSTDVLHEPQVPTGRPAVYAKFSTKRRTVNAWDIVL